MAETKRPRVFLDVNIGAEPIGRLLIELFVDKTPRTCENFRRLCVGDYHGMSYVKAPFHRVIDDFMIQGGDIANGDGTGTASIYNGDFEDENMNWRDIDAAGLLCSANRGRDTNGSQFFITLDDCPHLNGKHTIFGHLLAGQDVLEKVAKVEVDKDDRPLKPVLVGRCGELEKRKTKAAPVQQVATESQSSDRGRRRRSDLSDEEMENSPEPQKLRKPRRQSDNIVDEGLRGRPRQRSNARSDSRPLSSAEEDDEDEPACSSSMHKRKRSPSPSRHQDGHGHERRRRRSLPNQYDEIRSGGGRGDEDRYRPSPRRHGHQYASQIRDDVYRSRREGDRYWPSRSRDGDSSGRLNYGDGRLGTGGHDAAGYDDRNGPPVKFKGRGVMKYREPGRL